MKGLEDASRRKDSVGVDRRQALPGTEGEEEHD